MPSLLAGEGGFVPFEVGLGKLVQGRCVVPGLLLGAEDSGERGGEESHDQVRVLYGPAVEGVPYAVQAAGEELGLLPNAVSDSGGEFAGQGEVARHAGGEFFRGIDRVVDFPFELVDKRVRTDSDVQLDEDPHLVVLVSRVGQLGVQGVLLGVGKRIEVVKLLVNLGENLLVDGLVEGRLDTHVFHQLSGEILGND